MLDIGGGRRCRPDLTHPRVCGAFGTFDPGRHGRRLPEVEWEPPICPPASRSAGTARSVKAGQVVRPPAGARHGAASVRSRGWMWWGTARAPSRVRSQSHSPAMPRAFRDKGGARPGVGARLGTVCVCARARWQPRSWMGEEPGPFWHGRLRAVPG